MERIFFLLHFLSPLFIQAQGITEIPNFGVNDGNLRMYIHEP